jgi:hypothetical protein
MNATFNYARIEISGKDVLVDKKDIADAGTALAAKIQAVKDELKNGFVMQTPEGMIPVDLGSAEDLGAWVARRMQGGEFKLSTFIGQLPEPFKTGLNAVATAQFVLYSAALFFSGGDSKTSTTPGMKRDPPKLYGELVVGFRIPSDVMDDFLVREVVIAINNFSEPKKT